MLICVWRVIAVVVVVKIYAFNITTNFPFPFLSTPLSSGIVQDHIIVTCLRVVQSHYGQGICFATKKKKNTTESNNVLLYYDKNSVMFGVLEAYYI